VGEQSWQAAGLGDIPAAPPYDDPESWREYSEDPLMGTAWRSVGHHLGIRAFGVNANEAPAGHEVIPEHDELETGGQEELYVVMEGRARFECDGESTVLGPGEVLYAAAAVRRRAIALESPTVVLAVGGTPGRAYG
jgi:uncharacterized cupin superfamily protein